MVLSAGTTRGTAWDGSWDGSSEQNFPVNQSLGPAGEASVKNKSITTAPAGKGGPWDSLFSLFAPVKNQAFFAPARSNEVKRSQESHHRAGPSKGRGWAKSTEVKRGQERLTKSAEPAVRVHRPSGPSQTLVFGLRRYRPASAGSFKPIQTLKFDFLTAPHNHQPSTVNYQPSGPLFSRFPKRVKASESE